MGLPLDRRRGPERVEGRGARSGRRGARPLKPKGLSSANGRPSAIEARRVVVTGAAGWLGRALDSRLSKSGRYSVLRLDKAEGDLAEAGRYEALLGDGSRTTVVHLAASLDRSPAGATGQWRDTFGAGRNVLEGS